MRTLSKLIHITRASYLPTVFPAHYYGMPNGKVYLIFSRFYENGFNKSGLEFVFAEHNEFSYDYKREKVLLNKAGTKFKDVFAEQVDKPNAKFKVLRVNRNINSYGEAHSFLNSTFRKIIQYQ